MQRQKRFSA